MVRPSQIAGRAPGAAGFPVPVGAADRLMGRLASVGDVGALALRRVLASVTRWRVIDRLPVSVVHLDEEIATRAAMLRARHHSLKLPDALVIATAAHSSADRLITTDRKWPTARAMKLTVSIEQI